MQLTKTVRQQLLELNSGFERMTHDSGKNYDSTFRYRIDDGVLHIRESGKTSWADSRYDNSYIASPEQTHRFLRNYRDDLDWDGVDPSKPLDLPEPEIVIEALDLDVDPIEVDDEASDESALSWSPDLTGKQWAAVGVAVGVVLGVGFVAYKYGPPLWNHRVRPAVARLRDKLRGNDPDAPLES